MTARSDVLQRIKIAEEDELRERIENHRVYPLLPPIERDSGSRKASYDAELQRLLRTSTELTRSGYGTLFALLDESASKLGLRVSARLFKKQEAGGSENATVQSDGERTVITFISGLLNTVDNPKVLATILAHEIGHLGFGHTEDFSAQRVIAFDRMCCEIADSKDRRTADDKDALRLAASDEFQELLRTAYLLWQVQELNADRAQLLAVPDLSASISSSMLLMAGAADRYGTYDPQGYLDQGREAACNEPPFDVSDLLATHPNAPQRALALEFFSRTEVFRELTGFGPATERFDDFRLILPRLIPVSVLRPALARHPRKSAVLPKFLTHRGILETVGTTMAAPSVPTIGEEASQASPVEPTQVEDSPTEIAQANEDELESVVVDEADGPLSDRERAELTYMLAYHVTVADGRATAGERRFMLELVRPRRLAEDVTDALAQLDEQAFGARYAQLLEIGRALPARTKSSFLKMMINAARIDRRVDDAELRVILDAAIALDAEAAGRRLLRNAFGSRLDEVA